MRYTFLWANVPAGVTDPLIKVGVEIPSSVSGTVATASTPELKIQGNYAVDLLVSDGCSTSTVRKCFEVQCNCRPTANAGATATVWSNNDGGNFRNLAGATGNTGVSGGGFLLDGSLSSDFDLFHSTTEQLTYQWDFVSWEPSNPLAYATHFQPSCAARAIPYGRVFSPPGRGNYYNDAPTVQTTWSNSTNISATANSVGYRTFTQGTALARTIEFQRIPVIRTDMWTNTTSESRPVTSAPTIRANDFPMWYPSYHNNAVDNKPGGEENFMSFSSDPTATTANPTTTGCMAWVTKQESLTIETTDVTTVSVLNKALQETNTVFCKIQISQSSAADPKAALTILHPGDSMRKLVPDVVTVASMEYCAGLWLFRLTVMDQCGASRASTDEILITVRCNRPPVAVVKCDTTVIFKSDAVFFNSGLQNSNSLNGGFEQVTLDGRSSSDADNDVGGGYLTYYWSFLEHPAKHADFCKVDVPCQQQYCQLVVSSGTPYSTAPFIGAGVGSPGRSFGNATRFQGADSSGGLVGVTQYDGQKCAPTVYPVIYDLGAKGPQGCTTPGSATPPAQGTEWCRYDAVPVTVEHKGNSAYFTPSVAGVYKIQLAVFDGCSTAIDTVTIEAQCPPVVVAAPLVTGGPITFAGSATASVAIRATVTYGDNPSSLVYKFVSTPATGSFSAVQSAAAGNVVNVSSAFVCSGLGSYTFVLQVDDGCQVSTSQASAPFVCRCNAAPTNVVITTLVDGVAPPVGTSLKLKDTNYEYPVVTLTVASTDADNDIVRYNWDIQQGNNGVFSPVSTSQLQQPTQIINQNTEVRLQPASTEPGRQYRFTVNASDGCSTTTATTIVTFECTLQPFSISLTPATPARQEFSFGAPPAVQGFQEIKFDASASVTPYPQRRAFSWCIFRQGSSCAANDPVATQASAGRGTASLSWTPPASAVGIYEIQLNVTDGCGAASTRVTVETACKELPKAALSVVGPNVVVWNSFDSSVVPAGAFPVVTLDATASTQVTGGTGLAYDIAVDVRNNNGPVRTSQGNSPSQFTYRATGSGVVSFRLTVANGPCRSGPGATEVSVTFQCLLLQTSLTAPLSGQTVTAPGILALPVSQWDGLKYPKVCLDGTKLTYSAATRTGETGNLNSLRITWRFTDSPILSAYLVNRSDNTITSRSFVQNFKEVLDVDNVTTSRYTATFQRARNITRTVQSTTLFNHHYNLPYTCFQPDVAGNYAVELLVEDGCQSQRVSATVTASCPAPTTPVLKLVSPATATMEMTGIKFQRVHFDARDTVPRSPKDTLTYVWTLSNKPLSSKTTISNPQGNIASIVPDLAGVYNVTLSVFDGCNPVASVNQLLTIFCTAAGITISQAEVSAGTSTAQAVARGEAEILWRDSRAADPFAGARFSLTGKSETSCTVVSRRWRLISRECTDPYRDSAPTVTVTSAPTCKVTYNCNWKLVKYPCQSLTPAGTLATTFKRPETTDGRGTKRELKEGDSLENTAGRADQCNAKFTCNSPGTYQLSLTVDDGCSTDTKLTTVTCKCETKPIAVTSGPYTSIYACDGAKQTRTFTDTTLDGSKSSVEDIRGGLDLAPCPTPALPLPLPQATPGTTACCPAQPACPTCPSCPSCPVCTPWANPMGTVGGAAPDLEASLPAKTAFYAVPAMQSAPAKNSAKFAFTDVMGVTVSLLSIMVMTLAGNFLLHLKVRASEKELALL